MYALLLRVIVGYTITLETLKSQEGVVNMNISKQCFLTNVKHTRPNTPDAVIHT